MDNWLLVSVFTFCIINQARFSEMGVGFQRRVYWIRVAYWLMGYSVDYTFELNLVMPGREGICEHGFILQRNSFLRYVLRGNALKSKKWQWKRCLGFMFHRRKSTNCCRCDLSCWWLHRDLANLIVQFWKDEVVSNKGSIRFGTSDRTFGFLTMGQKRVGNWDFFSLMSCWDLGVIHHETGFSVSSRTRNQWMWRYSFSDWLDIVEMNCGNIRVVRMTI